MLNIFSYFALTKETFFVEWIEQSAKFVLLAINYGKGDPLPLY